MMKCTLYKKIHFDEELFLWSAHEKMLYGMMIFISWEIDFKN